MLLKWPVILFFVAPFAGARIEIPLRSDGRRKDNVAPFAGARIEIEPSPNKSLDIPVAPFAGARIEIRITGTRGNASGSLPSRERGLKL